MTQRSITFQGKTYIADTFVGMPSGAVSLSGMMGVDLLALYNLISANLGGGRVKRFADNKSGVKRTWAKLCEWDDQAKAEQAAPEPSTIPVNETGSKVVQDTSKPNSFKVQLSDADKAQIASEKRDAKAKPAKSEQLLAAATVDAERTRLRQNPPASSDPAKDAEMPALRRSVKPLNLEPKAKVYPRREGTKQAILVDTLSRPEGATFGELYDALAADGKPWRGVSIRSGLAWDMNAVAGYGVSTELLNGEEFAAQGRAYEANRLGMQLFPEGTEVKGGVLEADEWVKGPGYDPEVRLGVYRLTYPKGMDAPLPHTGKKKT